MALVFGLLVVAMVLFVSEFIRYDLTAIAVLVALVATDIITVEQGLSGFANPATVTIAALFVLSEGLRRTGALDILIDGCRQIAEFNQKLLFPALLVVVGTLSAFMNNTAVVAIMIPVTIEAARVVDVPPSRFLMPMSFVSIFGGVCTLIGTSTNLLISDIIENQGLAPISMFELTPVGFILLVIGFVYVWVLAPRFLGGQKETDESLTGAFSMREFLTDLELQPSFPELGTRPNETDALSSRNIEVVEVFKSGEAASRSDPKVELESGDTVRVKSGPEKINELVRDAQGVALGVHRHWEDRDLEEGEDVLVEAVIAPEAPISGEMIEGVDMPERFGAIVLAIRRLRSREREDIEGLGDHRVEAGDSLLLKIPRERVESLKEDPNFVVVSELDIEPKRRSRLPFAIAILVGVVSLAALDIAPIVLTAIAGSLLLVLTGCLTAEDAYEAINWKIIFLLAGLIPLGAAMETTGASHFLAGNLIDVVGDMGIYGLVGGFFGLTMLLTNVVSNAATAVLLAPIAISASSDMGIDPRPVLVAVTFGASLSFITPIGYQTNTLVFGPGRYSFGDFAKFGTPLNIITWILVTILIPVFWPA